MRRAGPWLAAWVIAFVCAPVARADLDPVSHEPQVMLVGALVHRNEVGSLDVLVDEDGYLIPLEPFVQLASVRVERDGDGLRLATPLGTVEVESSDVREVGGVVYLRETFIEDKLAAPVVFDTNRYALNFDLPWRSAAGPSPTALQQTLVPDATPPNLSLSALRSELRYTRNEGDASFGSTTSLGGRMARGYWRLRYQDDLSGFHYLRDYSWFTARERLLYLAGHQDVRLHPLLQSIELTGLQVASTNQSMDRFNRPTRPGALLPRGMQPFTSFRGPGPPGGFAELRVNGRVVERQVIGLDGTYDFEDVSLAGRQASRIEIRVYDRHNPELPVAVYEEERSASEFLLGDGDVVQMGGVGQRGNAVHNTREEPGYAGFYQARLGVTDGLTVEAAIQQTDLSRQVFAGMVTRLVRPFVMSVGLAASEGAGGYRVELDGRYPRLRVVMRSQMTEAGFNFAFSPRNYDHLLEVGYDRDGRWSVGIVGQSWANNSEQVEYLLPAAGWRPLPVLSMRARPDSYGDYRFDLSWQAARNTRVGVSTVADRGFIDVTQGIGVRYQLAVEGDFGGDLPDRQAATMSWRGFGRWRPGLTGGLSRTGGELGYLLGAYSMLYPGIAARLQYESDPRLRVLLNTTDRRLLFNVTADVGLTEGRIHAARAVAIRDDRGGVAGVVRVDAPREFKRPSLAGLRIVVDGKHATRTESDGSFFIGGLRGGVHRVELDPQMLPIELSPTRSVLLAEVAPAAVTRVDLVVRPEFGVAGRVRDTRGNPVGGVYVTIIDESGARIGATVTDRFGLYRIDGLPVGRYVLRPEPADWSEGGAGLPERKIEILDDFLFDQDLVVPTVMKRPPDPMEISESTGRGPHLVGHVRD